MSVALSVKDLTFTYLHSQAPTLRDISFEIESGTVTAFVGPVGAGKSTLFQTLNGLIPEIIPGTVEGSIEVAGHDVEGQDPAFIAQFISVVFDDPSLQIFNLTAEEDVAFGPANLNIPREEIWERVYSVMETVGLKGFEKRDPRTMSGGEQQLLAFAGILAMRPQIVALDEPVAMLDPVGKTRMLKAVQDLNERFGTTVLIAESGADIEPICEFADRIVLMHEGRILATGRPEEVFARHDLISELQLRSPQVTRIAYGLDAASSAEVPVTLDQGRQFVLEWLGARGGNAVVEGPSCEGTGEDLSDTALGDDGEPAVRTKALHHVFPTEPPVHALQGIDITIAKGDFVALLGQNGSGKTTLSFHLVGVEKPTNDGAEIMAGGVDVLRAPLSNVVRKINYVFQNPSNQLFRQTFGEEVIFGPEALGFSESEVEERARAALAQVGLERHWDHYTLSVDRSQETLLSLASILAIDPEILIADEPTGGLDHATGQVVMETLRELNRKGRTIVIITHDMELAAEYARHVIILRKGEVFMEGTPQEVFSQPEKLAETQLAPPQAARLAMSLATYGFPCTLTPEAFVSAAKALKSRNGKEV